MRFLLLSIQIGLLALPAHAEAGIDRYVAPGLLASLAGETPIVRALGSDGRLALAPDCSSAAALAAEVGAARPTVAVEVLRVLRGLPQPLDTPAGWLKLYNGAHAVSTMKGLTYWSASRQQQRVLFTESFAIPSARSISPVADPVFAEIPPEDILHTFQQDQSYGKNTYAQRFTFAGDHLLVRMENTSTVSVAFIPLMQPGGFATFSILIPAGKDLLFYGVSYIRTSLPTGDRHKRQDSLANRLIALSNWLRSRLS